MEETAFCNTEKLYLQVVSGVIFGGVRLNMFAPFNLHHSSVAAYQGSDVYAVPKPRLLNSFIPFSMSIRKAQLYAGVVCSTVQGGSLSVLKCGHS